MARNVRFVPDGSNPTRAIRRGFYERPPAFGGRLAPGEADAEVRGGPSPLRALVTPCFHVQVEANRSAESILLLCAAHCDHKCLQALLLSGSCRVWLQRHACTVGC